MARPFVAPSYLYLGKDLREPGGLVEASKQPLLPSSLL